MYACLVHTPPSPWEIRKYLTGSKVIATDDSAETEKKNWTFSLLLLFLTNTVNSFLPFSLSPYLPLCLCYFLLAFYDISLLSPSLSPVLAFLSTTFQLCVRYGEGNNTNSARICASVRACSVSELFVCNLCASVCSYCIWLTLMERHMDSHLREHVCFCDSDILLGAWCECVCVCVRVCECDAWVHFINAWLAHETQYILFSIIIMSIVICVSLFYSFWHASFPLYS